LDNNTRNEVSVSRYCFGTSWSSLGLEQICEGLGLISNRKPKASVLPRGLYDLFTSTNNTAIYDPFYWFSSATCDYLAESRPNFRKNLASFVALPLWCFMLAADVNLKSLY